MKKEQPMADEHVAKIVPGVVKQEKENVIVFKKKNSGKVARSNKDPISDQEIEHPRLNGSLRPKPQLPSEESVKSEKAKGLPVLSLAGASAGYVVAYLSKKLMIQKALLEYAKNLPASNPYQEKEALQQETLQLKQKNNDLASQNIRLKTKLMTVEKENLRLQRVIDQDRIYPTKDVSTAVSGARPANSSKSVEQTVHSMKGLLRDTRKELDELREENGKIKKSVKYTRINELEQQKKSKVLNKVGYFEETVRLRQLLEEQFSQNIQHKMKEHDMSGIQHKLAQLQESNHSLRKENSELSQKLKKAEEKVKGYSRFNETEKNLNRMIAGLKRTIKDKQTELDSIKKDVKESKEVSVKDAVHEERDRERERQKEKERVKVSSAPKHRPDLKSNPLNPLAHHHPLKCENCSKAKAEIGRLHQQIKKLEDDLKKKDESIETLKNRPPAVVKSTVKKPSAELMKQVADFLSYRFKAHHLPIEATETYLFKKDQVKEGEAAPTTTSVGTMIEVLLTEPFFITNSEYLEGLIVYLFYGDRAEEEFEIDESLARPNSELFELFKKLVGEYSIMEAKKEQEMFIQIAELVTNYCQHISAAFDSKRNGEGTISKTELCAFLNQIELEKEYIDFIITQIILESIDLEHLNYFSLFEIFYLPVQEEAEQGPNKMLGIQGEVKELDEEYEDSHSHNNDAEEYSKKGSHHKKASNFRARNDKSLSKKDKSQSKVEEDYYEDFDDQEAPVQKKELSKKKAEEPSQQAAEQPQEQEYSADYQM